MIDESSGPTQNSGLGLNITSEKAARPSRQLNTEDRRLHLDDAPTVRKARIKETLRNSGPTPPGATSNHCDLYDELGLPT